MRNQYKLNRYDVNNIVYYINDYRVVKSVIDEVIIKQDKNGTHISYTISSYKKDKKPFNCVEAYLVDDLETAKQSALTNWRNITQDVEKQLTNLTEEMFEPIKNDK